MTPQQELIDLTAALVRFQTMHSRPDDIIRCADFIQGYLERHGIRFRRMMENGIPSILALPEEEAAPVTLMSHIDVVDGTEDLFQPVLRDGKLYGRGALDDKYAVALSLVLFKNYLERLRKSGKDQADMPFGLLITGDEEIGGANGADKALDTFRTDFGIALDGGDLHTVVIKEKGLFQLRLTAAGKAAHGSRPWLGVNAVERLMEDYLKIKEFFKPEALAYPCVDHWHRTLNLGVIRAGKSVNQVPDQAEALLDIRFTEHDDMDALFEEMKGAITGELTLYRRGHIFEAGSSPHLDRLLGLSDALKTSSEHGASDARHLSRRGVPGIVWGADGAQSFHARDEHVDMDSVAALYGLLERFMDSVTVGRTSSRRAP